MGTSWEDKEKFAHAIVVVPDGRIVCQRPVHPSFVRVWQATAYHKIPTVYAGTPEAAISSATYILWSAFKLHIPHSLCTHLVSHYVEQMGKRLELVLCKMQSGSQLVAPKSIEIMLIDFEELVKKIGKDRGAFAPHTLHAINVLETMVWGNENG